VTEASVPVKDFPSVNGRIKLPRTTRLVFFLYLLGITVLQRFGLNLGFYTINFSLISVYLLLSYFLYSGWVKISLPDTRNYFIFVLLALLSYLFSTSEKTLTSLALVLSIYLPFCFKWKIPQDLNATWLWVANTFVNICLFVGVCGILQYVGQFFIKSVWLVDFSSRIPDLFRATEGYNTVIQAGAMFKSNGFFLLEPSGFSQYMAIGLLCEWNLRRRKSRMILLCLGLLVSYSGTGILTLLLGAMFPLGLRTVARAVGLVVLGLLAFLALGNLLNLSLTLDRLNEFDTQGSSASDRFVAPMQLVQEQIGSGIAPVLLGNGSGSITRADRDYTTFDPTWARLFFEYGLLGSIAFLWFFARATNQFSSPSGIRAGLFFCWFLMGDGLGTPETAAIIFLLAGLWGSGTSRLQSAFLPIPISLEIKS
jgi:hypothetical protein